MSVFKCAGRLRFVDGEPYCDYESTSRWTGKCPGCQRYYDCDKIGAEATIKKVVTAGDAVGTKTEHLASGVESFDRVLSGGFVKGSTVLFGGVHGAGKSSLLMSVCNSLSLRTKRPVVFASSEQSANKLLETFERLEIVNKQIEILEEKNIHEVLYHCEAVKPALTVFDSLQNFRLSDIGSSTTRELTDVASAISEFCQKRNMFSVIVSQMNKQLEFTGTTSVPHLIETELMLYRFDPHEDKRAMRQLLDRETRVAIKRGQIDVDKLRVLICGKNRDGEEGLKCFYTMTARGLQPFEGVDSESDA